MKKLRLSNVFSLCAVLLISAFPVLFLYLNNADEAEFAEVLTPLLGFIGVGGVLFFIALALTRSCGKATMIAGLFSLAFSNFVALEYALKLLFPSLRYWHTVTIVGVILLHIAYLIYRFVPRELSEDVAKILCLVFGVLIGINLITGLPKAIARAQALKATRTSMVTTTAEKETTGKPNIYLIIFDEYSNFPQMQTYYNYDNRVLRDFLEKNNFNVSETSVNESIGTTTVLTNLINLDYLVDNTTPAGEKETLRKNASLFSILREYGYELQVADVYNFFGQGSVANQVVTAGAATLNGESLSDLLLRRTVLYPFFQTSASQSMAPIMEMVNYVCDPSVRPASDTFTLVYLSFPHQPFLVDENGAPIPPAHSADWEDDQYYLGQYKYATKLMIQMADSILTNNPDSIIMLQSDHGARSGDIPRFPLRVMHNPFNVVYYRNLPLDIEGLSSVNTLRKILNQTLGTAYEMLSVPEDDPSTYSFRGELPQ